MLSCMQREAKREKSLSRGTLSYACLKSTKQQKRWLRWLGEEVRRMVSIICRSTNTPSEVRRCRREPAWPAARSPCCSANKQVEALLEEGVQQTNISYAQLYHMM